MFEELIQSEKEVNIYYGGEKVCISGIITDYHKQYELIRLNTQGMVLPVHGITKIEIVDDSPCSALFSKHQLLRHDCDFDNAMVHVRFRLRMEGRNSHSERGPDPVAQRRQRHPRT